MNTNQFESRYKKKKGFCVAILVYITCSVLIFTQAIYASGKENDSGVYEQEDITVTSDVLKEEVKNESQSMTIINIEDIERKQGKSVEDIIFNEVGISRTVDSMGKVGISIRGAAARHTLILIDGQQVIGDVSKYSGAGDELMRIGAENIHHIEIIRGASSAKYGSDAIGGVVNIITKRASKTAGLQVNAEGRYHTSRYHSSNESDSLPSNFYLRADTGDIGNFRMGAYASKRDILAVYSERKEFQKGVNWYDNFKPSLRYYGDIKNIGTTGEYQFFDNHKISFRITGERENVERRNKNLTHGLVALLEPMQIFGRDMTRNSYHISYTGKSSSSDWQLDVNYGKTREDDVTLLAYYGNGHDKYSGQNSLGGVDWLEHKKKNINLGFNTYLNDKHYVSYGAGYTEEDGEGSRLKNAPKSRFQTIDPWNYDKSLFVPDNTAGKDDAPDSHVHNYKFVRNENGFIWDRDAEYYGEKTPPLTYEEAQKVFPALFSGELDSLDPALQQKFKEFNSFLQENNDLSSASFMDQMYPAIGYYGLFEILGEAYKQNKNIKYNGKYYGEGFDERKNQLIIGNAQIKKSYGYIQDEYRLNKKITLTPIMRLDHSELFGSNVSANLGMQYKVKDHLRLKANVGSGYSEPGMGELYYNWEMYGGSGKDQLGWYWIGNPDLEPERSLNMDLSVEGETGTTFVKASIFHNEITDYLTSYFTGQIIDFNFLGATYAKTPDRIYSFRNLGKARISGAEVELQHRFFTNWFAKIGYTYLHAINESDDDMPHRLLDKPTHKFDLGLNYKNNALGLSGALWGSYYVDMLDSNSVKSSNLFKKDANGNYIKTRGQYNEKTFGLWNVILEKSFGESLSAYVGIDNIFNHRDDERAFQDRVYRFGMNMKFDALGDSLPWGKFFAPLKDEKGKVIVSNVYGSDWFLSRSVDTKDKRAGWLDVFGDYRLRTNSFGGGDKAVMRETKQTQASDAAAWNHADNGQHGLEQRLRLGFEYQILDRLNLNIVASTGENSDSSYSVAKRRGLHDVHVQKAELTYTGEKWDLTAGRIHEKMGVTGYWFGQEYDGIRSVYTSHSTQFTVGYGDFSHTTGISNSAYNHKEKATIQRAPTLNELLGYENSGVGANGGTIYVEKYDPKIKANYREKFNNAGSIKDPVTGIWKPDPALTKEEISEAKLAVARELVGILKDIDKAMAKQDPRYVSNWKTFSEKVGPSSAYFNIFQADIVLQTDNGSIINLSENEPLKDLNLGGDPSGRPSNVVGNPKYGGIEGLLQSDMIKIMMNDILDAAAAKYNNGKKCKYMDAKGNILDRDQAVNQMFVSFVGTESVYRVRGSIEHKGSRAFYNGISKLIYSINSSSRISPVNGAPIPLPGAPITFEQEGYFLCQDTVPEIHNAGYAKLSHQLFDNVGVELWYLSSFGSGTEVKGEELKVANVIGLGTKIKLGERSMFSFDYGQNRSQIGRYFKGGRDEYGAANGGGEIPYFWVARLDSGLADTNMPGSWNAYFDYKYFDHGSFLGGTGANLPDRYLDGVRSFSTGLSYVPVRNLLLEASYTFGAESTQSRDTLYTPETFDLGDYVRLQLTYRF